MTEPSGEPSPSLIQQRFALGRLRLTALFMMIGGGAMALLGSVAIDPTEPREWILLTLWVALALSGVGVLLDYRRKVRAFEAEHGPDAGKQS